MSTFILQLHFYNSLIIEQHKEEIIKYENKINDLYLKISEELTINERFTLTE